ncbi:MAG: hypothetical protein QM621_01425 [Aeromicrobium sp.]|uniref:DUF6777 domain-containing protein n=1 Tax=Aeromicrobium sp. TaxID=1871063 RepID=UPI0039E5BF01
MAASLALTRPSPFLAAGVAALMTAALATACGSDDSATPTGEPVVLEAIDSAGDSPFTDSVAGEVELSDAAREAVDERDLDGQVGGDAVGLYGGTTDNSACDQQALADFLAADDAKNKAWADTLELSAESTSDYIASLTPAVLTRDTAVVNHGFENGEATAFNAVLQAGSAVLVDATGAPVVRCACGNPLATPTDDLDLTHTDGSAWDGYEPKAVIGVTPAPEPVEELTLLDATSGDEIRAWDLADPSSWTIGPDHFGPVTADWTADQIVATGAFQRPDDPMCRDSNVYWESADGSNGVHIDLDHETRTVYRSLLWEGHSHIVTDEGVTTGDTLAEVRQAYADQTLVIGEHDGRPGGVVFAVLGERGSLAFAFGSAEDQAPLELIIWMPSHQVSEGFIEGGGYGGPC